MAFKAMTQKEIKQKNLKTKKINQS